MLKGKKNIFKLHCYNENYKSQAIKCLLEWSKVEWEYIEYDKNTINKDLKFSELPVLEYKNSTFVGYQAIEFYLAKKFKLLGKNENDEFNILELQGIITDIYKIFIPIISVTSDEKSNFSPTKNIEDVKNLINVFLPYYLGIIEKRIVERRNEDNDFSYYKDEFNRSIPSISNSGLKNMMNEEQIDVDMVINSNIGNVNNNNSNSINVTKNNNSDLKSNLIRQNSPSKSGYFLGNKISLGDFILGTHINNILNHPLRRNVFSNLLRDYPAIDSILQNVTGNDFLKYYQNNYISKSFI